jgi:sugar phosphate isomerase/epimerase
MAGIPDLICTYFTLAGPVGPFDADTASPLSLDRRARAAGAAGYRGLGFNGQDIHRLLTTLGAAEVNAILDANGLVHRELEVLLDWFVDGERRAASDRARRLLLDAAGAIGARHIKVGGDTSGRTWPLDRIVEEFARLCDEAAAVGTAITIELFPTANLADLQTGRAVVEGAGRANGGLLLDIWHMVRGNIPLEAIAALPGRFINHIELDDGTLLPRADYLSDTIHYRVAPGEGEFPCRAFLDAVRATGYQGLYGVEILSDAYRAMAPEQAAAHSWRATAGLFATGP